MNISYKINLQKQGVQECAQASAVQILNYYGIDKALIEVKNEVPVYIDSKGEKRGTSLGHIATYFQNLGLKSILHTSDILIFDRSWSDLSSTDLIEKILARKNYVNHGWYDKETISVIIDGYVSYLKSGGKIKLSIIDSAYIQKLLEYGPLYMVVSYNILNNCSKYDFALDPPAKDSIKGVPSTHAIVVSGYKDDIFEIADPDYEHGGHRDISESLLIAAYYEAQTDMDNLLMSFSK